MCSVMACEHPASSLRVESVVSGLHESLTLRFTCSRCLAPITKEFLGTLPEPSVHVGGEVPVSQRPLLTY